MHQRFIRAGLVVAGLGVLWAIFSVEFPYRVHSRGIAYPKVEWTILRSLDGNFVTTLKDYSSGQTSSRNLSEFLRGNEARFVFQPGMEARQVIQAGDTIGGIFSEEESLRLRSLEGELRAQEASLSVVASGSKPSQREEAEKRLQLAQLECRAQERALQRSKVLFADSLISEFELLNDSLKWRICETAVEIAQAVKKNMDSGEKSEQVEVIVARVQSLKDQISILKQRQGGFTLVSPISGLLIKKKDVLGVNSLRVSVVDTTGFVVLIPVPLFESHWIREGDKTVIHPPGNGLPLEGTILSIDNSVQILNGRQSLFVTAGFHSNPSLLMPGAVTRSVVYCDQVTSWIFLKRVFQFFIQ
jgi:hypothetical protein